jgi:hypothetical protein
MGYFRSFAGVTERRHGRPAVSFDWSWRSTHCAAVHGIAVE